ncbi:hypothetical protein L6164_011714 [Bauhinia variegata]|uniref:Uncharacterized protein n=1 Tax=Bauhinia variegata TaxID=167791 RepID=A0ACB9P976_BAUVA|nr:hypothetical protein L6164_011714 [Bauhinia variegata]
MAVGGAMKSNVAGHLCKSNIGISNLAESIFMLSINACQLNVGSICISHLVSMLSLHSSVDMLNFLAGLAKTL